MAIQSDAIEIKGDKIRDRTKKILRKEIEEKLEVSFAEFRTVVAEKKFKNAIEKAGDILAKSFTNPVRVGKKEDKDGSKKANGKSKAK